jgi:hypothetical protein
MVLNPGAELYGLGLGVTRHVHGLFSLSQIDLRVNQLPFAKGDGKSTLLFEQKPTVFPTSPKFHVPISQRFIKNVDSGRPKALNDAISYYDVSVQQKNYLFIIIILCLISSALSRVSSRISSLWKYHLVFYQVRPPVHRRYITRRNCTA